MSKDFSGRIEEIMSLVEDGSDLPFAITREDGKWNINYFSLNTTAAPEEIKAQAANYLAFLREKDPFTVSHTGTDFAKGSLPYVYDKVFCARLRAEYEANTDSKVNAVEFNALLNAVENNIGDFSQEVIDYLLEFDQPLRALYQLNTIPLYNRYNTDGEPYDANRIDSFIEAIESKIAGLIERPNVELVTLSEADTEQKSGKRIIDGYEEMYSIQINGRLLFIGENTNAEHRYMVCEDRWDNVLGANENVYTGVTNDFLEAIGEYTKNVQYYINCAKSDRDVRQALDGVEPIVLTTADCVPNGMSEDIKGKVIIIKSEVLTPEKQTSDYQLKIAMGGFGCTPNSRGNAVFCKDLYSDIENRFERYDVLGVADLTRLPEWAKTKLADIDPPAQTQIAVKSSAQLHKECASAIDAAVSAVRTPGEMAGTATYDLKTAFNNLSKQFGEDCVNKVLAAIVVNASNDGRYSAKNKAWAASFDAPKLTDIQQNIRYCTVNTHPTVLDGLVNKAREGSVAVREEKPDFLAKINDNKQKVERDKTTNGDIPINKKKRDGQEV